jgi:hypothetical protein
MDIDMKSIRPAILLVLVILILISGCTKRQAIEFDLPTVPTEGYYEIAWVEPEIVVSDSLFTLIRAERIDSIFVEGTHPDIELTDRSITFKINRQFCNSKFSLVNSTGQKLIELWNRDLTFGYYKVNINPSRIDRKLFDKIEVLFRVDFCQSQLIQRL